MLVHSIERAIERAEQRTSGGAPRADRSAGGAAAAAAAGSGPSGSAAGSGSTMSSSSGASSSMSGLIAAIKDAGRLLSDPAFEGVPVPAVFLGGLPSPIPSGRPTLNAQLLVEQLQKGVLPSDALGEGDREVWRAASGITGGPTAAEPGC